MGKSKEFIAVAIDKTPHGSSPLHFVLIVSEQQAGTECWASFLKWFYGACVIPHWHTSFHTSTGCFGCQTHVLQACSTQTNIELTLTSHVYAPPLCCIQWVHTSGDTAGRTHQAGSSPILASWRSQSTLTAPLLRKASLPILPSSRGPFQRVSWHIKRKYQPDEDGGETEAVVEQ